MVVKVNKGDTTHLFDLSSLARCLDVLEMDFRFLGEVNNGAKEVEETLK